MNRGLSRSVVVTALLCASFSALAAKPATAKSLEQRVQALEQRAVDDEIERVRVIKHDEDDLAAQNKAADAAARGAKYARGQYYLSLVGALLLFVSLGFTFWAVWLSRKSINIAARNAEIQLRAYITVSVKKTLAVKNGLIEQINFEAEIHNSGSTIARMKDVTIAWAFNEVGAQLEEPPKTGGNPYRYPIGAGQTRYIGYLPLKRSKFSDIFSKKIEMTLFIRGSYIDVFDNEWPVREVASVTFKKDPLVHSDSHAANEIVRTVARFEPKESWLKVAEGDDTKKDAP